jgi:hypothetical protein
VTRGQQFLADQWADLPIALNNVEVGRTNLGSSHGAVATRCKHVAGRARAGGAIYLSRPRPKS